MEGHIPQRMGSLHPNIAPYGELFRTNDERFITFAIGSNKHFAGLCNFLALKHLISDPRFSTNGARVKHRNALYLLLKSAIESRTSEEINTFMLEHFIPMGIVRTLKDVFNDPAAQQLIREETIEGKATKRVTSIAFQTTVNAE
jgi:crotonobetainyl-CoA:carnitine CoA-transferase CaiB-like acyl-CoA transferase